MTKLAFTFFTGHGEEEKLSDAVSKNAFNLFQGRRDAEANIAAQSGDWLVGGQRLDDKQWLDELRGIEFSLRTEIAQVLGRAQAHQTFYHKLISFSHCS